MPHKFCPVKGCLSHTENVKFVYFPKGNKTIENRQEWMRLTGLKDAHLFTRICEDHFVPEDFKLIKKKDGMARVLKTGVFPSRNLPTTSQEEDLYGMATAVANSREIYRGEMKPIPAAFVSTTLSESPAAAAAADNQASAAAAAAAANETDKASQEAASTTTAAASETADIDLPERSTSEAVAETTTTVEYVVTMDGIDGEEIVLASSLKTEPATAAAAATVTDGNEQTKLATEKPKQLPLALKMGQNNQHLIPPILKPPSSSKPYFPTGKREDNKTNFFKKASREAYIQKLEKENANLKHEVASLRKKNDKLSCDLNTHRRKVYTLDKKVRKLKKNKPMTQQEIKELVKQKLSGWFSPSQINILQGGNDDWQRYRNLTQDDYSRAMALRLVSDKGYRFMRRNKYLPLPSETSLNSATKKFPVPQGIHAQVLQLLKNPMEGGIPLEQADAVEQERLRAEREHQVALQHEFQEQQRLKRQQKQQQQDQQEQSEGDEDQEGMDEEQDEEQQQALEALQQEEHKQQIQQQQIQQQQPQHRIVIDPTRPYIIQEIPQGDQQQHQQQQFIHHQQQQEQQLMQQLETGYIKTEDNL